MGATLTLGNILLLSFYLTTPSPARAQETGQKIVIASAPSLTPLAERFSALFRKDHPEVKIVIRGGGSNHAVAAARRGEIDIGLVTRGLSASEKADLIATPFDRDAIFIVTYSGNPVLSLTLEQLRGIYLGKITNWREVRGEMKGITPFTRESKSGVRRVFLDLLFGKGFSGEIKAFTIRARKEKVLKTIKRIEGSIGYGILGWEQAEAEGVRVGLPWIA
jgi:phosphate transport system substrate-binding protein